MRVRALFLGVCALAALAASASGQRPPTSPVFIINTATTNYQGDSSLAMASDGHFVVVWTSYESGNAGDVWAQGVSQEGFLSGNAFRVNTYTTSYQYRPAIAMSPDGAFVVVWSSYGQNETSGSDIRGQRYDAGGFPLGSEFRVNSYTTGYQYSPAVAMDAKGDFVVVWSSYKQTGDDSGSVRGQVYAANGAPVGGEFHVNQYTTDYQFLPSVAYGGNGDFIVTWASYGQDGDKYGVYGRRFAGDGTPRAAEFPINQYTTSNQFYPSVAADSGGDFVVAWHSFGQDGDRASVIARRFGSSGVALGDEFQVNTYTSNYQSYPRAAMDAKGRFTIVWESFTQDGDGWGVFGRRYDSAGGPLTDEFQVNVITTGNQFLPEVAVAADGHFAICGQSPADNELSDVYAVVGAPLPRELQVDPVLGARPGAATGTAANGVLEPGETALVPPTWFNNTELKTDTGTASNFSGPPGATYTIDDASADYGALSPNADFSCLASSDCYTMTVSNPATRPAAHWDAHFDETLGSGGTKTWLLHVGESFPDVPDVNPFYAYIENLFHNGITGGCGNGNYCPATSVNRAQMAVFLLKAKHNPNFVPPACTPGTFGDVACPSQFADWIQELAHEGITGGCGGGNYCPTNPVTRAQMAVFLLKAEHGSDYVPPACTPGFFADVACPSQFANWIEQLADENVTGGCGGGNYCPNNPNTRGQMAVFLVRTFGLKLYGP